MSQCEAAESSSQVKPQVMDGKQHSPLDELLRQGARQMLVKAVEAEVAAYIEAHQHEVGQDGRRLVVRNGHARQRTIVSGAGQLKIQAPRVDDRRVDEQGRRFRFTSEILPPYLRRTKSVEELIPWLYLKGISTGDFSEALEALLGPDAPGLSAATVVRLKDVWRREPLWVTSRRKAAPISMSAFRGKADVDPSRQLCPLLAKSGHSVQIRDCFQDGYTANGLDRIIPSNAFLTNIRSGTKPGGGTPDEP